MSDCPVVVFLAALASIAVTPSEGTSAAAVSGPVVLDGGVSIAVSTDQHATIVGDSASLRAVVDETCRQAGIQLRTYAASDHPYVGRLVDVPLADALRSMLRSESYLVGLRADGHSSRERITWLRVLGGKPGTGSAQVSAAPFARPRALPAPQSEEFVISPSLISQAFGNQDPAQRAKAQGEILAQMSDPEQLPRFLASDSKKLAKTLVRYRGCAATVRRLLSMTDQADVQAKLDELLAEVESSAPEP